MPAVGIPDESSDVEPEMDSTMAKNDLADICQQFREEWADGGKPWIEHYLEGGKIQKAAALFIELLSIEMHERRKRGERVVAEEYIQRFPEYAVLLKDSIPTLETFRWDSRPEDETDKPRSTTPPKSKDSHDTLHERYRLIEKIGRGGFGEVWRAYDEFFNEEVAIKGPRRDRNHSPGRVDAFLTEAQKLRKLKIAGVVPVENVVHQDGYFYVVMQLLRGGSLADRMRKMSLTHAEAADFVAQLAEILHQVHLQGITHRDLKPANILFDEKDNCYIGDFGLAATEEEMLAEPPSMLGTLYYMPPEQIDNRSNFADPRSDIYSLGVILHQLLTDRLPYEGADDDYAKQVLSRSAPRSLRLVDPKIPQHLDEACQRCLLKDPAGRFSTADDLARTLRQESSAPASPAMVPAPAEDTSPSQPISAPAQSAESPNRPSRRLMIGGLATAGVAAAIGIPFLFRDRKPDPPGNGGEKPAPPPRSISLVQPRPLVPSRDKELLWNVVKESDNHAIRFAVDDGKQGLLALGKKLAGKFTITAVFDTLPRDGQSLGLFFGYHENEFLKQWVRYEVFGFYNRRGKFFPTVRLDHHPRDGKTTGKRATHAKSTPQELKTPFTIQVTVTDARVNDLRLAGRQYPKLSEPLAINDKFEANRHYGEFGIWCRSGGGRLLSFSVDHKILSFQDAG